jgi:hypothetical protein
MNSDGGAAFIFVGGAARSGTTLLQNMLDSHPDICGAPEFHHIVDIALLRKRLHQSVRNGTIDLICSHEDVDRCLCDLVEGLLLPVKARSGCRYLSEKTPENVLAFPELVGLFPEAHFVHVVRDPRAVIASMLQVGKRAKRVHWPTQDFTHSVLAAVSYIRQCLEAGLTASRMAPERVATVWYEKLVTDPEAETKRLCSFFGIDWSGAMLHPGSRHHLGEKASTSLNLWYNSKSFNRDPEATDIDKWRNELSLTQQAIIATAFRNDRRLKHLGYDLSMKGFVGQSLSTLARLGQRTKRSLRGSAQRVLRSYRSVIWT